MTKTQLAENIIKSIEKSEWDKLQDGRLEIPVSEHNRKVLLELRGSGVDYTGEVCDKDVHRLSDAVYEFLKVTWPEEPEAHKYVVLSCLVLTFLREEPMHPKDKVQYEIVEHDGIKEYHCPVKTEGVICKYCVARHQL